MPEARPRSASWRPRLRSLTVDLRPLRQSRDFRLLWAGLLVSMIGRQVTVVAVPYQVYLLTHSSLAVGLLGLVQLFPLIAVSLYSGALADSMDRRQLLMLAQIGLAATSVLLALTSLSAHAPLWALYAITALSAGLFAIDQPARQATVPRLVSRQLLPAALSLQQVLFQLATIAGPSLAGIVIARFGLAPAYLLDVACYAFSIAAISLMAAQPTSQSRGSMGWKAPAEGLAYVARNPILLATFAADLAAMVLAQPRALFPALADRVFHVGPSGLGLLFAAPGAGALLGAVFSGWVSRVRRQGLAVIVAVAAWGCAVAGFGLSGRLFPLALLWLAAAGAADMVSAVFRSTILQLSVPDSLRGRMSALHMMVVTGGPRLGDLEAGALATLLTAGVAVTAGGLACVAAVGVLAVTVPALRRYRSLDSQAHPDVAAE